MDGAPTNDRDAHQKDWWMGFWYDGVWRGKFKQPNSRFEFSGTMTLHTLPTGEAGRASQLRKRVGRRRAWTSRHFGFWCVRNAFLAQLRRFEHF
jgi:hypothetical protein